LNFNFDQSKVSGSKLEDASNFKVLGVSGLAIFESKVAIGSLDSILMTTVSESPFQDGAVDFNLIANFQVFLKLKVKFSLLVVYRVVSVANSTTFHSYASVQSIYAELTLNLKSSQTNQSFLSDLIEATGSLTSNCKIFEISFHSFVVRFSFML
jgi:mRNA-degrading endonuclease YafQ of YafQ-DinJ toxin-antitoxin module